MSLLDLVNQQLDDQTVTQLSQQLGVDAQTTRQAVPAALTALLGGLSRNAAQPAGAQDLLGALAKDHDGSILNNFSGALANPQLGQQGTSILGHIFGGHRPAVESQVGRSAGLNAATAGRLLILLAPFVLGALGRMKREKGLDQGGLSEVLGQERQKAEQAHPQHGGLLNSIFDRDGDGQILDDLAGMAGGLLTGRR